MAIAYDNASSGANKESTSLTVSHTATGSDLYAVIVIGTISNNTSSPVTTSCTYAGSSCTKVASDGRSIGTNRYLQNDTYIYPAPPTGAQNVVATLSASPAPLSTSLVVATYTGVYSYNAVNAADGASTAPSVSVTTTAANTYVVGGIVAFNSGSQTVAPGTDITERAEQSAPGNYTDDDHRTTIQDKAVASAGATTFNGTLGTSAQWGITGVELWPSGAVDLKTDLVSWWSLDETSGTRYDSHGTNDLTTVSASYATGKVGNAADLERDSSNYLQAADSDSLSMTSTDFTFAAWVNTESFGTESRAILTKYTTAGNQREYELSLNTSNIPALIISTDGIGFTIVSGASALSNGAWYFVVGWFTTSNNYAYLQTNLGSVTSENIFGTAYSGTAAFAIGRRAGGSSWFDGLIDEVAIWKRALSTGERTWLYNSGNGRAYSELAAAGGKPAIYYAMMTG